MPCESHDEFHSLNNEKDVLSDELSKEILGSLSESGEVMSEQYEYVDEIDNDEDIDNEDWANYLITEKKSTLSKIKGLLGLNQDYINTRPNKASQLDSKNGLYKIV